MLCWKSVCYISTLPLKKSIFSAFCFIGFLFTIIFYKSKSLIPCIITHSVVNSLSAFASERTDAFNIIVAIILIVISLAYAAWILKREHKPNKD